MEKAFIFHGTGASPSDHWFPWMKEKLEEKGVDVYAPEFPTPENQSLEAWKEVLREYPKIDEDTVLIGHSTGAVFILSIFEKYRVEAAYLISGFTGKLDIEFDDLNESFAEKEFDFEKIRSSAEEVHIFHSDSDPYVPLEKAESLARNLEASLHLKAEAGHFNTESGYTEFPELLKEIENKI